MKAIAIATGGTYVTIYDYIPACTYISYQLTIAEVSIDQNVVICELK